MWSWPGWKILSKMIYDAWGRLLWFLPLLETLLKWWLLSGMSEHLSRSQWLRKESWVLLFGYLSLLNQSVPSEGEDAAQEICLGTEGGKVSSLSLLPAFRPLLWMVWGTGAWWTLLTICWCKELEGAGGLHWEEAGYTRFSWKRNIWKAMEEVQATFCVQRMTPHFSQGHVANPR